MVKSTLAIIAMAVLLHSQFAMAQAPTAATPRRYALLIGVTKYDANQLNRPPLLYPESDATAIAKRLKTHGYAVTTLLGEQATRDAIRDKLKELSQAGSSDGAVVVGLFGHGVEFDGSQGAMYCPYDTSMRVATDSQGKELFNEAGEVLIEPDSDKLVKMSEVLTALRLCKAGNKLLLADCCRNNPNAARGRAFGSSVSLSDIPDGTACLFACSAGEKAFEHEDWKHGAMTKAFLDHFSRLENPDSDILEITGRMSRSIDTMVRDATEGRKKQTLHPIIKGVVDLRLSTESKLLSYLRKNNYLDGITIYPGQLAPELPPLKFYEGEPVTAFQPGKIYVLTSFASWCDPCIYAIQTLSKLQTRYPNVNFIDIDVSGPSDAEQFLRKSFPKSYQANDSIKESAEGYSAFVNWWTGKFGYRFAADLSAKANGDGSVDKSTFHKNWSDRAGVGETIPFSFVVDQSGMVAWIGHPAKLEESKVLEDCLARTMDFNASRNNFLIPLGLEKSGSKIRPLFDKKLDAKAKASVLEESLQEIEQLTRLCESAMEKESVLSIEMQLFAAGFQVDEVFEGMTIDRWLDRFSDLQTRFEGQTGFSNNVAWALWERFNKKKPVPLELLRRAGQKLEKSLVNATDLEESLNSRDTLAHIEHALGNTSKAIELQTETVRLAPEGESRKTYETFLAELRAASKKSP